MVAEPNRTPRVSDPQGGGGGALAPSGWHLSVWAEDCLVSSLWRRLECLRWTWLVLPTISPAEVHREAFFMESTILLMAPALENSPRPSTKFCSCWLSLAKHFCSMGPFFAPGGLFFFGCSFVNTLKHLYNVDIVLPHLDRLVCLDTLGPSELLPGKRLSIPMCHVASARRMALKLGLVLWGGGGGFQAPGPGVEGEGGKERGGKCMLGGAESGVKGRK